MRLLLGPAKLSEVAVNRSAIAVNWRMQGAPEGSSGVLRFIMEDKGDNCNPHDTRGVAGFSGKMAFANVK
jgi:hypothetical protein